MGRLCRESFPLQSEPFIENKALGVIFSNAEGFVFSHIHLT